jgi:hypothetical protein
MKSDKLPIFDITLKLSHSKMKQTRSTYQLRMIILQETMYDPEQPDTHWEEVTVGGCAGFRASSTVFNGGGEQLDYQGTHPLFQQERELFLLGR